MNRAVIRPALWACVAAMLCTLASCSNQPTTPVVLPDADSIAVSDTLQVAAGGTTQATVTAYDSLGHAIAAHLTFASSDPAVFTVTASGVLRGQSEGVAVLRVTSGAARDSAIVVVTPLAPGWYSQPSGAAGFALDGVFVLPDGRHGWAVGASGKVLATTNGGVSWSMQTSGTAANLSGVWFTSTTDGWAVGKAGVMIHTTDGGASWTRVTSINASASEALDHVQFTARDTGWVVGGQASDHGVIFRTFDRGQTWQRQTPTTFALHGVSFATTTDGWAVGDNGVVLGTHDRGASYDLRAVCFPAVATGWTVGSSGVAGLILRSDNGGASWTPQSANTSARLNAVFFIDATHGWAVGENGVILHTSTGG